MTQHVTREGATDGAGPTSGGRRSAAGYLLVSSSVAGGFFAAASLIGSFDTVARIGGAVWVFMLTMIVSMPLVTARVKRRGTRP